MKWIFPDPVEVPTELANFLGRHPLVGKTLVRRGHTTVDQARQFLHPQHYQPSSPEELPGLVPGKNRLLEAVSREEKVAVWGDFDVDGQTSTALLTSALERLGISVNHYIPIRDTESHGINLPSLESLLSNDIDLLLTCDTGIDAFDAVQFAHEREVDVIITDHHQVPSQLPPANAVINPNLLPDHHPLYTLPGAGVAYKLIESLYSELDHDPTFLLDLVALAIVADLAIQRGDTRYLLQKGLSILRQSPRVGLQALCQEIDLDPTQITAEDIGFQIAPRLNALGRLGDANPSVRFLTTDQMGSATIFAKRLEALNNKRRSLTEEIYLSALDQLHRHPEYLEDYTALVLSDPTWHPGVIGIVASRLVERFQRPVLLLVDEGSHLRGSARSIQGLSIIKHIALSADLLTTYGGHPMAAGLELDQGRLPELRRRLSSSIANETGGRELNIPLKIDATLPLAELSLQMLDDLSVLAPFGPGNPPLKFCTSAVTLLDHELIGRDQLHRKLLIRDQDGTKQTILWWKSADLDLPQGQFDLAYTLSDSTFRGDRQLQLTLLDTREIVSAQPAPIPETKRIWFDHRSSNHPSRILEDILSRENNLQIWAEGDHSSRPPQGHPRTGLSPGSSLVIWNSPPSRLVFTEIVQLVDPARIYLFSIPPPSGDLAAFVKTLMGMVKYHLTTDSPHFDLTAAAEFTCQTKPLVRQGLSWLHARGDIQILSRTASSFKLDKGSPELEIPSNNQNRSPDSERTDLIKSFAEIQAYRLFYRTAVKDHLL